MTIHNERIVKLEEKAGLVRYPGSADELLNTIATLGRTAEELEHIAAMISNPNR